VQALRRVRADLVVAAVDSDRLYPPRLSEELAAAAPTARPLVTIESPYGHDGFLIETHQVAATVRQVLPSAGSGQPARPGLRASGPTAP
jgi:homoserine O-acetyltransferase/O-succinyltransferase